MILSLISVTDRTLIFTVDNLSKKRKSKYLHKNIANSTSNILKHHDVLGGRTLILFIFISRHIREFFFKHLIFLGYSSGAMTLFFWSTDNNFNNSSIPAALFRRYLLWLNQKRLPLYFIHMHIRSCPAGISLKVVEWWMAGGTSHPPMIPGVEHAKSECRRACQRQKAISCCSGKLFYSILQDDMYYAAPNFA